MKVSILVPLYGVEQYVEQCARSLFEQRFESCEFIFVDDATPDRSCEIVEQLLRDEYPHQIDRTVIIRHEMNRGVLAARESALHAATGHFVIFVDSDDWCDLNMVEEMVIEQMDSDADVIGSDFYCVAQSSDKRVAKASPIGGVKGMLKIITTQSFAIPNRVWGMLIRRSLWTDNEIVVDRRISMGDDFHLLVQLLYHARSIAHVSLPLYYYRVGVGMTEALDDPSRNYKLKRSYIRAVASARAFLLAQPDYAEYTGALRLSRVNLRRWLLLRHSKRWTPKSALYRGWCWSVNLLYQWWCAMLGRIATK